MELAVANRKKERSFDSIASATSLPSEEVVRILEEMDLPKFSKALGASMRKISAPTDLNSSEIWDILSEDRLANLDDIVMRLHEKSNADRKTWLHE
jgi:hypothetical protein